MPGSATRAAVGSSSLIGASFLDDAELLAYTRLRREARAGNGAGSRCGVRSRSRQSPACFDATTASGFLDRTGAFRPAARSRLVGCWVAGGGAGAGRDGAA